MTTNNVWKRTLALAVQSLITGRPMEDIARERVTHQQRENQIRHFMSLDRRERRDIVLRGGRHG